MGKRLRYTIPNSFTASSLLIGVGSIVTGQLGHLELAGWMIVWCGLLDVMDGLAARMLKATSDFGAEFDSMADLVAFGVAPGMLMLQVGMEFGGFELFSGAFWILLASVGVFVLCGAMRLARDLGPGHTVVTILCDYGTRYQSKLFNPEFLRSKDLPVPEWLDGKRRDIPTVFAT